MEKVYLLHLLPLLPSTNVICSRWKRYSYILYKHLNGTNHCIQAKEKNGIDATKFYNVGVVGTSGVGKSSLINGLCRWDDGDEGAVPVGIIEGPQGMKSYTLPQRPIIQLWDVPGTLSSITHQHKHYKYTPLHTNLLTCLQQTHH